MLFTGERDFLDDVDLDLLPDDEMLSGFCFLLLVSSMMRLFRRSCDVSRPELLVDLDLGLTDFSSLQSLIFSLASFSAASLNLSSLFNCAALASRTPCCISERILL